MKKTLVIGASENSARYSSIAIEHLLKFGHTVVALGKSSGSIHGVTIETGQPELANIHTIILYLNSKNQLDLEQYIVSLRPERVIFPPNTENEALIRILSQENIEIVEGCTMLMLASNVY